MSDRELLELSALAAGLEGYEFDCRMRGDPLSKRIVDDSGRFMRYDIWNPLTDDGAALRLAAKLKMNVCLSGVPHVYANMPARDFVTDACYRRAIVRAAAEIGKAMQAGDNA